MRRLAVRAAVAGLVAFLEVVNVLEGLHAWLFEPAERLEQ